VRLIRGRLRSSIPSACLNPKNYQPSVTGVCFSSKNLIWKKLNKKIANARKAECQLDHSDCLKWQRAFGRWNGPYIGKGNQTGEQPAFQGRMPEVRPPVR